MDRLVSHTTMARRLVSSSNCLTYSRSLRPRIFQSTYRSSSPGWYIRCSANSTREAAAGRTVEPAEEPFDDAFGDDLEPAELGDLQRVEQIEPWSSLGGGGAVHAALNRRGVQGRRQSAELSGAG